jgi:CBS domain-containing protein
MSRSIKQKPVVMPPVPPGESSPDDVQKTRAVAESLTKLGEQARPVEVARDVRAEKGITMGAGEAAAIQNEIVGRGRGPTPPGPDQPPPQQARKGQAKGSGSDKSGTRDTRRTVMLVKDVMTKNVECVRPDDTLQEAARKMRDLDVGPMPVCDGDRLAGMVTDRDITIRATAEGKDPKACKVRDVLTKDVVYCFEDQNINEAAELMQQRQIRRVLVLNRDKRLTGIVSLGDLAVDGPSKKETAETVKAVSEPATPRR